MRTGVAGTQLRTVPDGGRQSIRPMPFLLPAIVGRGNRHTVIYDGFRR